MKYLLLTMSIFISFFCAKAQQDCVNLESILIAQESTEVILQTSFINSNELSDCNWLYFNEDGSNILGDEGMYDTISNLDQNEFILIMQIITTDSITCTTQDTLSFENEEWILIPSQINEGLQACVDSTGTIYEVGSEMFLNDCDYVICEEDENWSDIMTLDDCLIIECIAGTCIDVGQLGQEGSYSSIEECQESCGTNNQLAYECVFDACVDVGQFGQEGSYSSLEECQESCGQQLPYECVFGACIDVGQFQQVGSYSSEEQCLEDCQAVEGESSYECVFDACVDIGQFGQEGSYDSLEECEKSCQTNNETSSYECIADMCVDIGQFGQQGSYSSLEECQQICEGAPASIQELSADLVIAPNPFKNYTQVLSKNDIISYNLFDIKGRRVNSKIINSNNFILERKHLPQGIYYLEIFSQDGHAFKKVVIK